jgi:hypothetical protein
MNAVTTLEGNGYEVWAESGKIHFKSKTKTLPTQEVKKAIDYMRTHKAKVLEFITKKNVTNVTKTTEARPIEATERGEDPYDVAISEVVRQFDEAGLKMSMIPAEVRERGLAIEQQMTDRANEGDKAGFDLALSEWRAMLLKYRPTSSEANGKDYQVVMCPYGGRELWPTHPEACAWHRDEKDPLCEGCINNLRLLKEVSGST